MNTDEDLITLRYKAVTFVGDLILQPFTNKYSSETRLVPHKDSEGNYQKIAYDALKYESQMAYHNAVTREILIYENPTKVDKIIDNELDNHYDSTFFLFVLQEYIDFLHNNSEYINTPRDIPEITNALRLSKYVRRMLGKSKGSDINFNREKRRRFMKPL